MSQPDCARRECLDVLRQIERKVPEKLDVHIIVGNYAAHKYPRVKRSLAARSLIHVHFTPTYATWLNQVENWFNHITHRATRREMVPSVKELVAMIDQFVRPSNAHAQLFVLTATADSILADTERLCNRIPGTAHPSVSGVGRLDWPA